MTERLREIAEQVLGPGFDLLGKKAQVVRRLGVGDKHLLRLVDPACHGKNLGQPETAEHESTLLTSDTVVGSVAVDVGAITQLRLNPLDRSKHAVVIWWKKTMNWEQKQGCIGMLVIVCGDESLSRSIQPAGTKLRM